MNKELEEAIKEMKYKLRIQNKKGFCNISSTTVETILNYIEILETATNNRYPYVIGGRTLYSRLQQVNKEYLIKNYLRLRNETEQLIKEKENSISKEVIEEIKKKTENKLINQEKRLKQLGLLEQTGSMMQHEYQEMNILFGEIEQAKGKIESLQELLEEK